MTGGNRRVYGGVLGQISFGLVDNRDVFFIASARIGGKGEDAVVEQQNAV